MWKKILRFLRSPVLWLNLLAGALLILLVFWGSFRWLDRYTMHNESVTVPDLRKMTLKEADELLADQHLRYTVIDSTYCAGCTPTEILAQDPPPGARVKEKRHIYLTINNKVPPKTKLPDLVGKSLRNAISILKNEDLDIGEISYEPYPFANAVIRAEYKGREVKPGTSFTTGTRIDLVVGNGLGETKVSVPRLIGKTLEEAKFILHGGYNLNIGFTHYSESVISARDSAKAVIYRQNPNPTEEKVLRWGEFIDVWLMKREAFEIMNDTTLPAL